MTFARRALVLDDEPFVQSIIRRFLARFDFRVDGVSEPTECIEQFRQAAQTARYDIVFLDLNVDDRVTGVQVFRQLHRIDPGVCAVAVSGSSQHPVVLDPKDHGFAAAIAKPFTARDVEAVLASLGLVGTGPQPPTLDFDD